MNDQVVVAALAREIQGHNTSSLVRHPKGVSRLERESICGPGWLYATVRSRGERDAATASVSTRVSSSVVYGIGGSAVRIVLYQLRSILMMI